MGLIRKILDSELNGSTSTEVYPITSTKAVFNENNISLDTILKSIGSGSSTPELGGLLTSLNSLAAPTAEGYLHFTGSTYEWIAASGGTGTLNAFLTAIDQNLNLAATPTFAGLIIGNIKLEYDSENSAIKIVNKDGTTAASLYTTGGLAAFSDGTVNSGGTTSLGGLLTALNSLSAPTSEGYLHFTGSTYEWATPTTSGVTGITSVGLTVPAGFSVTGSPLTSNGTLGITFASGYSLPTTSSQTNWNSAYSNSHTHSNKTLLDSITTSKIGSWDTAAADAHTHSNFSYLNLINQDLSVTANPNFNTPTFTALNLGGAHLSYDSTNKVLRLTASDGTAIGFSATGNIIAYKS